MHTNGSIETDEFFQEYTSTDAILKYSRATAGTGISYLLEHDYKNVYLDALRRLPPQMREQSIRVLEFGCGAGMNLIHLLAILSQQGINVIEAIGTDFSPVLIDKAREEAKNFLREKQLSRTKFFVAKNETLIADLAASTGVEKSDLEQSFHFIFGVNTIRYCHAAEKEMENARDIFELLAPGGICVVIDMNDRFPLFRSDLRNMLRWKKREQCCVPSLEEYAAPFHQTGFKVLRQEHFCWVPHSAGEFRRRLLIGLSPILNATVKSRAMRSLVVAQKPLHS